MCSCYFMISSFVYGFFCPLTLFPTQSLQFSLSSYPVLPLSRFSAGSLWASLWNSPLAPSCRLCLCPWFINTPTSQPLTPQQARSHLQGGQPLGRIDRPCKSLGCCNKISSSWDLWGQMHVEEETPTVHEIVKNARRTEEETMPTFLTVQCFANVVLFSLICHAGIAGIQMANSGGFWSLWNISLHN